MGFWKLTFTFSDGYVTTRQYPKSIPDTVLQRITDDLPSIRPNWDGYYVVTFETV